MKFLLVESLDITLESFVQEIIKKDLDICRQAGFGYYVDKNQIQWKGTDSMHIHGRASLPLNGVSPYTIEVSNFFGEDDSERIHNTILHELAHVIVDAMAIENGIIHFQNGNWFIRTEKDKSTWCGHGNQWKTVAKILGTFGNTDITRTKASTYSQTMAKAEVAKYVAQCDRCGYIIPFKRRTKNVDLIKSGNAIHTGCGGKFKLIKGA